MTETERVRITSNELRFIADNIPAMVSYIDSSTRFCFVNAEYGRWLGRSVETIVGKTMEQVLGSDISGHRQQYVDQVLQGKKVTF